MWDRLSTVIRTFLCALIFWLSSEAATAADAWKLVSSAGTAAVEITVDDDGSFHHQFRVENSGDGPLTGVTATFHLLMPSDPRAFDKLDLKLAGKPVDHRVQMQLEDVNKGALLPVSVTGRLPDGFGALHLHVAITATKKTQSQTLSISRPETVFTLLDAAKGVSVEIEQTSYKAKLTLLANRPVKMEEDSANAIFRALAIAGGDGAEINAGFQKEETATAIGKSYRVGVIELNAKLPRPGTFAGDISFTYGSIQTLFPVSIVRKPTVLRLLEADGNDRLEFGDWKYSAFERNITVFADTPLTLEEINKVKSDTSDLQGPGGALAFNSSKFRALSRDELLPAGADEATQTVEGVIGHIELKASIETNGTYSGVLQVDVPGGKSLGVPVAVTRSRGAMPLEALLDGEPWVTLSGFPGMDTGVAKLGVALSNTDGSKVTLKKPAKPTFTITQGDVALGTVKPEVKISMADSNSVGPWTIDPDGSPQGKPDDAAQLAIDVSGFGTVGRYKGQLVLQSGDYRSKSVELSFRARRDWYVAALAIFFGIVLSWWLRWWMTAGRPVAKLGLEVLRVQARLDELEKKYKPLLPVETDLLAAYRQKLQLEYEAIADKRQDVADKATKIDMRIGVVGKWMALEHRLAGIHQSSVVESCLKDLDEKVLPYLRNLDAVDAAATAESAIDAVGLGLLGELEELITNFENGIVQIKSVLLDLEAEDSDWRKQVDEVLDEARSKLNTSRANRLDDVALSEVSRKIDEARGSAAGLLSKALRQQIEKDRVAQNKPAGWLTREMEAEIVPDLANAERETSSAERRLSNFRDGLSLYIKSAHGHYDDKATNLLDEQKDLPEEKQNEVWIDQLNGLKNRLAAVPQLRDDSKLAEALKICNGAGEVLSGSKGVARDTTSVQTAHELFYGGIDVLPDYAKKVGGAERLKQQLQSWVSKWDAVYNLLILVIVMALGMYSQWIGNSTWGTLADVMLAFFWGLGLQTLATSKPIQFTSLPALGAQFSK